MDDSKRKSDLEDVLLYASQQSGPLGATLAVIAEALLSVLARLAALEMRAAPTIEPMATGKSKTKAH